MITKKEKENNRNPKVKRHTKIQTVYTLTKDLAQEYVKQCYSDRNNLVIHNVFPAEYTGYDVCFSYDAE